MRIPIGIARITANEWFLVKTHAHAESGAPQISKKPGLSTGPVINLLREKKRPKQLGGDGAKLTG